MRQDIKTNPDAYPRLHTPKGDGDKIKKAPSTNDRKRKTKGKRARPPCIH